MNTADYMRTLYDSQYWARDRLLAAAAGMSEEEYARENGFTYNSIRGILTHALGAEAIWMSRVRGVQVPPPESPQAINETNLPTLDALTERWAAEEKAAREFLEHLTDNQLETDVTFTRRDGVVVSQPIWQVLTTSHQHTLQHRAEAAEALTMIGRSPGNLDFIIYINEH